MSDALIGYTGFVGSNLLKQHSFKHLYNSSNISDISGGEFEIIVCAGIPAVKWLANKEPEKDWLNISMLMDNLKGVKAKKFILISTIDVYPLLQGQDESFNCYSQNNHAYGTHRLEFEAFCQKQFPNCHITRLPALFGQGLKKNIIFDLIHDNCLDQINPKSSFQYYYLEHLWKDIMQQIDHAIPLLNLFTEPVSTEVILSTFFSGKELQKNKAPTTHYDLHTQYAKLFNAQPPYVRSAKEVLQDLSAYLETQ